MALKLDSILKLPTPKKVLILAVILCAIAGLYLWRFFLPSQQELSAAQGEGIKLENELNNSRAIARDLEKYNEQVAKLNEELRNALTQLPNEKEIPEILKTISSLGKESNLEFTLFRPKPEQPQQFFANVPIDLVALGSYHNVGIFFDKVSKLPRIINVVDFNLTKAKDTKDRKSENEILLRTSCVISTYRFIEQKSEVKKSETKAGPKETAEDEISKPQKK
ncbi:MAG TPA: type 4a pilus biogenesis protein PilO [Thermodesulfobacteriota bacterium]|nr:type 4a pilus biogenesis protein PilO [Thermodesulfobacteriota bacterium]